MLLRGGGCHFGGGFVQTLRESSRLVGQIVGFRGSFLIRDAGSVKGFLGAPSIFHDELNRASGALGGSLQRENIHLGVAKSLGDAGDRTRLIINSDCELLRFGHVGTSCRSAEIIRPERLRGGGDLWMSLSCPPRDSALKCRRVMGSWPMS